MRFRSILPLCTGLLLTGCYWSSPPSDQIARIEQWASRQKCVGSLDRWSRHYRYDSPGFLATGGPINVSFVEAGHNGVPAGVYREQSRSNMIDDAQMRVAGGIYDPVTGKMSEWQCGCNFPPYDVPYATECPPSRR